MPSWIRGELVTLRKQNGNTQSEWLRFAFGSQVKIDKFPRAKQSVSIRLPESCPVSPGYYYPAPVAQGKRPAP